MRTVRYSDRGGGGVQGVSARGCLLRRVSAERGVSAQGVSAQRRMSAWGCLPMEEVSVPVHAGIHTHIPVDRMTDACKNITSSNYVADGKYAIYCKSQCQSCDFW